MIKPDALLDGFTVFEAVEQGEPEVVHIAVSFAGRLLADLGARVVRAVPPEDPLSRLKSKSDEQIVENGVLATYLGRDKQALPEQEALTFSAGGNASEAIHLILSSVAEPVSAGIPAPRVCVSAFGTESGLTGVPVSELGLQGFVGLTDLFGEPGEQPLAMGGHQSAYATGYAVFCAAMASLAKSRLKNEVDTAEVTAVDALAWVNWKGVAAGALGFPVVRGGKGAEAPVVKCANGHFAFMHLPNNWDDIYAEIDDPRLEDEQFAKPGRRAKNALALNEVVAEWAADKTWQWLYEFCQRCAIPGGPILGGTELLEEPLYLHRNFFSTTEHVVEGEPRDIKVPDVPMTIEAAAERSASKPEPPCYSGNTPTNLPLSGKLVLDLGIFTAGSVTSTLLADLGATVIKVESESYSDKFRIWPGIKGDSPLFTFNNRNKLGLNLDLKTDAGRETFLKLVGQADIVVENFRRGVLERLGIDYPVLQAANPKVVLASISGQGASGPGSGHVSFGSTLEAIGGVAALTGYPGEGCYISGRNLNYPDQIVCLYGAGAAIAAILKAAELERGMHIDVSQREVTTLAVGEVVAAASLLGGHDDFSGNKSLNAYIQDIYQVQDGWLCVTVPTLREAERLVEVHGWDLIELEVRLNDWLATNGSVSATQALREMGVAAFKANTGAEAAEEVSIKSGQAFAKTPSGNMVKGFPFQFKKSPMTIYEESPAMGEQTEQILAALASG